VGQQYPDFSFDPARLAELELAYIDTNHQLVSEANKSSPADTMV
jgi:hypothetical protein